MPVAAAVKQAAQKLRRKAAAAVSVTDAERFIQRENEELKKNNQDCEALLETAEKEPPYQVHGERDAARGEVWHLKNRIEHLERPDVRGPVAEDETPAALCDPQGRRLHGRVRRGRGRQQSAGRSTHEAGWHALEHRRRHPYLQSTGPAASNKLGKRWLEPRTTTKGEASAQRRDTLRLFHTRFAPLL